MDSTLARADERVVAFPSVREPTAPSWLRRSITIPAYAIAFAAVLLLSPLLFALALLLDLPRRRLALARCLIMLIAYLAATMAGIIMAGVIWARSAGRIGVPSQAYLDRNFRLECWWASFLFRAGVRIFSLRVTVKGDELTASGPILLFIRHASPVDNLIGAVYGSARHGIRLRWIINRWLLRDPCIDIVGNRLANAFVRMGTSDTDRFTRLIRELTRDLGPRGGVLIYPEGALFSEQRRERVIGRLLETDPQSASRASTLRYVLPPRLGGSLTLLDAAPEADPVFCAHTGLEVAGSYRALLSGDLTGRNVRIRFWRISRDNVPLEDDARTQWLWGQWTAVDDWIGAHRTPEPRDN